MKKQAKLIRVKTNADCFYNNTYYNKGQDFTVDENALKPLPDYLVKIADKKTESVKE